MAIGTTSEGEREGGEGNTGRVETERERKVVDILDSLLEQRNFGSVTQ